MSAEGVRRVAEAVRTGWLLYRADNPLRVELATSLPRVLLQSVFYILIGRLVGGQAGSSYAAVGVIAFAATGSTVISVCDIPVTDLWAGTFYRLQSATLPAGLVYLCRAVPYVVTGFASSVAVALVDVLPPGLIPPVTAAACLPLYALTAVTSAMFGLALAALAMGGTHDVLYGNLGAYVVLAASGIVVPATSVPPWAAAVGRVLPVTHGVAAARAAADGRPWVPQAVGEAACGAAWLALALAVVAWKSRSARRAMPTLRRAAGARPPSSRTSGRLT